MKIKNVKKTGMIAPTVKRNAVTTTEKLTRENLSSVSYTGKTVSTIPTSAIPSSRIQKKRKEKRKKMEIKDSTGAIKNSILLWIPPGRQ